MIPISGVLHYAGNDFYQRCFSTAGRAYNSNNFAAGNGQVHIKQHLLLSVTFTYMSCRNCRAFISPHGILLVLLKVLLYYNYIVMEIKSYGQSTRFCLSRHKEKEDTVSQQPSTAKEKIKSAFIKIYKEKAINEITIGNLAAEADVYRGTFYYIIRTFTRCWKM